MIYIKLLGGAKKALGGKDSLIVEMQSALVSDILLFLKDTAKDPSLLNIDNIIIAVNGTESSLLQGMQTRIKTGDRITIATVVHGGSMDQKNDNTTRKCIQ